MARRKYKNPEPKIDPEVVQAPTIDMNTLEIRGRGQRWTVLYPDPQNIASSIPIYDREGKIISFTEAWVATNKMLPDHGSPYSSLEEAKEAAELLHPGCNLRIIRTSKNEEALAKAREAKRKKRKEDDDIG